MSLFIGSELYSILQHFWMYNEMSYPTGIWSMHPSGWHIRSNKNSPHADPKICVTLKTVAKLYIINIDMIPNLEANEF